VFSVPLVSRDGQVLERHLLALAVPHKSCLGSQAMIGAARLLVAQRLEARRRRVDRLVQPVEALRRQADELIARHLQEVWRPGEVQAEMFSLRAVRNFQTARAASAGIAAAAASTTRDQASSHVSIGEPLLELVVMR
jgi:hypothetical protein